MKEVAKNYTIGFILIFAISAYVGSFLAVNVIYSLLPTERPLEDPSATLRRYQEASEQSGTQVFPSKVQLQPAVGVR
jgi:hypothetical protein